MKIYKVFTFYKGNKSHYDVNKWDMERKRTITYLKNIREHKVPLINPVRNKNY